MKSWVDWESIPPTAEWRREVEAAIEGSDSFLFVISPASTQSPVCAREVEHAVANGKRLVPIVRQPVEPDLVPEPIRFHNWIYFRDADDFDAALETLDTALHLDLDWLHAHTRLLVRAVEWDQNGRDASFVLRGRDLDAADDQLSLGAQHKTPALTGLQTEYLAASHRAATRSTRLKLTALTVALAVAAGLGVVAFVQRETARHEATVAQSRSLVSSATAALPTDPELSLLLARAAISRSVDPASVGVLRAALDSSHVRATVAQPSRVQSAVYDGDGQRVIAAYVDGTANVWDVRSPVKTLVVLKRDKTVVTSAALSPDGTHAVTGGDDGVISVWDLENRSQPPVLLTGTTSVASDVEFSPDGHRVVAAGTDGVARVWDVRGGAPLLVLSGHFGALNAAIFSPDGSRIATAGNDGTARIWDANQGGSALLVLNVAGSTGSVFSLGYSPSGAELVTASSSHTGSDAPAAVWSATTGQSLFALQGKAANVNHAAFSPDGTEIVTAGPDSTARIWDASQPGPTILTFNGHRGPVETAAFNPDGSRVLTAGADGTVRIWDARPNGQRRLLRIVGAQHTIFDAVISSDGRRVATASNDGLARIWNPQLPAQPPVVLAGHVGPVNAVVFSPDGTTLGTAGADGTARIWSVNGGAPPLILVGHHGPVNSLDFSPDGRRLATVSDDGTARIWDTRTGTSLLTLAVGQGGKTTIPLFDVSFSPDSRRVAIVGQESFAEVWDATRPTTRPVTILGVGSQDGDVNTVEYSPDGTRLVLALDNGTAQVSDARHGGQPLVVLTGHTGFVNDASWSPDGQKIVTAGGDGTSRIWDAKTGVALSVLRGEPGAILIANFAPDSRHVLTASDAGIADEWTCDLCVSTDRLERLAQQHSTRALTAIERRLYLSSG